MSTINFGEIHRHQHKGLKSETQQPALMIQIKFEKSIHGHTVSYHQISQININRLGRWISHVVNTFMFLFKRLYTLWIYIGVPYEWLENIKDFKSYLSQLFMGTLIPSTPLFPCRRICSLIWALLTDQWIWEKTVNTLSSILLFQS